MPEHDLVADELDSLFAGPAAASIRIFPCTSDAALDRVRARVFSYQFGGGRTVAVTARDRVRSHHYTVLPGEAMPRAFMPDVLIADGMPVADELSAMMPFLYEGNTFIIIMGRVDLMPAVICPARLRRYT